LLDAEPRQAAGNAGGAIGNFGEAALAIAADDAEEELGCFGHCYFIVGETSMLTVMAGLVPAIHVLLHTKRRTWITGISPVMTAPA
jgi:hypothetical protein